MRLLLPRERHVGRAAPGEDSECERSAGRNVYDDVRLASISRQRRTGNVLKRLYDALSLFAAENAQIDHQRPQGLQVAITPP